MKTKLSRSVSIVGTSTLGQFDFADPAWADYSMYEPWACAVHQAIDDAGITTKQIEKISYSHFAYFATMGHICAPVNFLESRARR